jgi:hypothetical protein
VLASIVFGPAILDTAAAGNALSTALETVALPAAAMPSVSVSSGDSQPDDASAPATPSPRAEDRGGALLAPPTVDGEIPAEVWPDSSRGACARAEPGGAGTRCPREQVVWAGTSIRVVQAVRGQAYLDQDLWYLGEARGADGRVVHGYFHASAVTAAPETGASPGS